ncbi:ATP-binding protein [Caldisericum exile]|uniref:ATP-binding protein n=1 Tax=Caldisericum exile TaxID=693075 RepID=UPI003C791275
MEKELSNYIGYITSGSFGEGLTFKLNTYVNPENIRIGDFVVVEGKNMDYLCVVDDIRLKVTTDEVFFDPPVDEDVDDGIEKLAVSSFVYNEISIFPYLSLPKDPNSYGTTVKTLPTHFSKVRSVKSTDFRRIIPEKNAFYIGTPLTSKEKLYIDLEKLSMRNSGLFGITGSGKSFFARIIFAGLIKNKISTLLIFDMHNEHGRSIRSESGKIDSLASLFSESVKIFDVSKSSKDANTYIEIAYEDVEPEDVVLVSDILQFSPKSEETLEIVSRRRKDWLKFLLDEYPNVKDKKEVSDELAVNLESLDALSRHLQKLKNLKFLKETSSSDSIKSIIENLKNGISVVVQFSGDYKDDRLTYYFVSNIITRRIFNEFSNLTEDTQKNRVVIAIEEAHKFLSKQYQANNVFGRIAREMRKFNVTLFIIDQRPSEIDPEVLSQIGTRLVMELKDENDINAVFQGASHTKRLVKILSTLEQKQALVFGYAVPLPLPINVRSYDEEFIDEMKEVKTTKSVKDDIY